MKKVFKKYSENCPNELLDNSDIIDLTDLKTSQNIYHHISQLKLPQDAFSSIKNVPKCFFDLFNSPNEWGVYTFSQHQGFYVIKNCLKTFSQFYLTLRALTNYCQHPYWNNYNIHKYTIDNNTVLDGNIWEMSKNKPDDEIFELAKRYLRWSQLGYLFHHDSHTYDLEPHIPLCPELKGIAQIISKVLKLDNCDSFEPDMVLANYYAGVGGDISKKKTTSLRPHTDTYELTMDYPIVTMSIGLPAIFMVGNNDLQQHPLTLWLNSGDVCIMSGAARTAVHAVPRVVCKDSLIPNPNFTENRDEMPSFLTDEEQEFLKTKSVHLYNYMKRFRINLSVRQVMKSNL